METDNHIFPEDPNTESPDASFFEMYKNTLIRYVEERSEIIKLTLVEKIALISGLLFSTILIVFFLLMFLLFSSVMLGFFLSNIFDSLFKGFGMVAGIYLVITLVLILFKKRIEKPVINLMIKLMLKDS